MKQNFKELTNDEFRVMSYLSLRVQVKGILGGKVVRVPASMLFTTLWAFHSRINELNLDKLASFSDEVCGKLLDEMNKALAGDGYQIHETILKTQPKPNRRLS